ncbi:uncharacterized protein LACBIDRAFT_310879 [Laccaria bicolor S238N-H82]|uniref:Predicted protein n=1 Tax=Laccaria bicolor (strain S238N-H82 / ATCC MYA-4686) TaxID=486041 RepID=B0DVB1_LACBS|nr:uncharacterized protein LACBIDRAFT_310879 [Laccaria bicolor S238N-H82]EDR01546.1 predicted protein [Laccaria bicolor S238N-H82]|eukprot:XP_001887898.1 predicted protein [Laccaria bicolor S238N-H82]
MDHNIFYPLALQCNAESDLLHGELINHLYSWFSSFLAHTHPYTEGTSSFAELEAPFHHPISRKPTSQPIPPPTASNLVDHPEAHPFEKISNVTGFDLQRSTIVLGLYRDECILEDDDIATHLYQTAASRLDSINWLFQARPEYASAVRKVHIRDPHPPEHDSMCFATQRALPELLMRLGNLTTLRLEDVNWDTFSRCKTGISQVLFTVVRSNSLTTLCLQHAEIPVTLFDYCRQLKHLELDSVDVFLPPDMSPPLQNPYMTRDVTTLDSLIFVNSTEAVDTIIDHCGRSLDLECLTTLGVDFGCEAGLELGWLLMNRNASSIQHIILRREPTDLNDQNKIIHHIPTAFTLEILPHLQTLEIGDTYDAETSQVLLRIYDLLSRVPDHNYIQTVRLALMELPFGNVQEFFSCSELPLNMLDTLLAGSKYPFLQDLAFYAALNDQVDMSSKDYVAIEERLARCLTEVWISGRRPVISFGTHEQGYPDWRW